LNCRKPIASLLGIWRCLRVPALAAVTMVLMPACASWWQVRPYPDFVAAEIQPGDRIRVETSNGESDEFQVVAVGKNSIVGEGHSVMLGDIVRLEKLSKAPPANPCSPQVPLGCSVPEWAQLLHESQRRYQDFFYPSCEQHDYCYRHGAATYGKSKEACDAEFLQDMQAQCDPDNLLEFLALASGRFVECDAAAMEFYLAVKKYGADRFLSAKSTYCEYDGPP
jgi:hypothetical protein